MSTEQETAAVHFRAPNGAQWKVFEMPDGTGTGLSLIFASDEGFRRVREYPTDWSGLDARALWELSWRR